MTTTPITSFTFTGWAQAHHGSKAHYFNRGHVALCGTRYDYVDLYPWQGYRPQCRVCLRHRRGG